MLAISCTLLKSWLTVPVVCGAVSALMTGGRLGLMRIRKDAAVLAPLLLLAPKVTVKSPLWPTPGVPLMMPLLMSTLTPLGKPLAV